MKLQIVVCCRMPHAGVVAESAGGGFLARARALMTRAEALGATLCAWSAYSLAFAWDCESFEEAFSLVASLDEDAPTPEVAWACGVAEGPMEALAPKGQRATLAWGPPLVTAVSLGRIADPGEVLVDGDVGAVRAGELNVVGTRASTDAGKRVRGWRLDKARPWRYGTAARTTIPVPDQDEDAERTVMTRVPELRPSDRPRDEVIDLLEETPGARDSAAALADRIKRMAHAPSPSAPDALLSLRKARARLEGEGAPASARCQASLALGVALAMAGRADEALLEGLDALARAREDSDPKAIEACLAFLAKLYARVARPEDAIRLQNRVAR